MIKSIIKRRSAGKRQENLSQNLSRLLEKLERFLKKGKSSEFNSRDDGPIIILCLKFLSWSNLPKTEPKKVPKMPKMHFCPFSPKALTAIFFRQVIPNRIVQAFPTMYDMPMIYFFDLDFVLHHCECDFLSKL